MSSHITYTACPACKSNLIAPALTCKDFTVSKTLFEVWQCNRCTIRFTQHVPDSNAIGKYYQSEDYVSHSETKEGLVNRLYHLVRNYTLKTKQQLVNQVNQSATGYLLDVGAGTGAFARVMKKAGWSVTGLEPDVSARKKALDNYGITLEPLDALYDLPSANVDVITMWHVLEHVHDLHGYLARFGELLRENGTLIVAVPNYTSSDGKHYGEFWAAYDVPRHLYHFSPAGMKTLMASHGFNVVETRPMWFDSFYVSMLSERYKGRGNLPAAMWNGLVSNSRATGDAEKCSSVIYIIKKAG
ncbi:class I SAM-dependent methyltransferase [Segetibacter sp. 3557_3]|uniref:class I SAM-dependent methyltransferase n=1 Tax=Segetibacter sp. 3557_3 TaxID=2547429 RepID=UPI0010587E2B|nr:class I SAM-dependent methyltransferase [Segetibacter sp. 3557_3]TDH29307.1 class I SAM-dependent methyltransferase [Segetibacter sp. 3557_3]